jgi:ribosomal protein L29
MANITIKTADTQIAEAIAEGAAAVELRAVKAEYAKLQAKDAVRSEADKRRWKRTRRRLARKYTTRPVGRLRGAILGVWGLLWLEVAEWRQFFADWNRGR